MDKHFRFNLGYLLIAMLGIMLARDLWQQYQTIAPLPYSEFRLLLEEGKIAEVSISADEIFGTFRAPQEGRERFVTNRVDLELAAELEKHGVTFKGQRESTLVPTLLSWILPALIFVGVWMLIMRRMGGGAGGGFMAVGKSKAKVYVETDTKVTFRDVAGVDEAIEELKEIVNFLKDPAGYGRLGARMPRGVLLVGPPGTGKTLLARAVAGEAGVLFFSISGSEFVEMFVGVGASRVRDLFEQARQKAPCIIFIDELDALGKARGAMPGFGGHDEKEQTLNQLLVELDGFDPSVGIVLLSATNRPEILDPALLRAGRFDRQILVDRPDRKGRIDILGVHSRKVKLAADVARRSGGGDDARLHRCGFGEPGERGGSGGDAPRRQRSWDGGLHGRDRTDRGGAWRRRTDCSTRSNAMSSRTTSSAMPLSPRLSVPTRFTRFPSSRAGSVRSAIPSSGRPTTAIS